MKKHLSLYIALAGLLSITYGCKKNLVEEQKLPFTSYTYQTTETTNIAITGTDLGLNYTYVPGPFCAINDTLYLSTVNEGLYSIVVYDAKQKKKIGTIEEWNTNGTAEKFAGKITHVAVGKGKLLVSSTASRVDVFDSKTLAPITTVGVGLWWGDAKYNLVHAFAAAVYDSLLLVRDKGNLVTFKLKDLTKANYKRVPIFSKSKALGYNNASGQHDIQLTPEGLLTLTDYQNSTVIYIDPKKMDQGTDKDMVIADKTLSTPQKVISIMPLKDTYIYLYFNGTAARYSPGDGTFTPMKDGYMQNTAVLSLAYDGNKIWFGGNDGTIRQTVVVEKEIKEYK